jgi:hypothetical protein
MAATAQDMTQEEWQYFIKNAPDISSLFHNTSLKPQINHFGIGMNWGIQNDLNNHQNTPQIRQAVLDNFPNPQDFYNKVVLDQGTPGFFKFFNNAVGEEGWDDLASKNLSPDETKQLWPTMYSWLAYHVNNAGLNDTSNTVAHVVNDILHTGASVGTLAATLAGGAGAIAEGGVLAGEGLATVGAEELGANVSAFAGQLAGKYAATGIPEAAGAVSKYLGGLGTANAVSGKLLDKLNNHYVEYSQNASDPNGAFQKTLNGLQQQKVAQAKQAELDQQWWSNQQQKYATEKGLIPAQNGTCPVQCPIKVNIFGSLYCAPINYNPAVGKDQQSFNQVITNTNGQTFNVNYDYTKSQQIVSQGQEIQNLNQGDTVNDLENKFIPPQTNTNDIMTNNPNPNPGNFWMDLRYRNK